MRPPSRERPIGLQRTLRRSGLALAGCLVAAAAAAAGVLLLGGGGGGGGGRPRPRSPWARMLPGFTLAEARPGRGEVWLGRFPGAAAPRNESAIYLPPRLTLRRRYPVVYLLHGSPGSPLSFVHGLHVPRIADRLILEQRAAPFIAVMPAAGRHRFHDEWAGIWEDYVVDDVVPWVDAHLPTRARAGGRTIAGLSAGGFGAVDIGLRHPGLFGTLEAWSGYFSPERNGVLRTVGSAQMRLHDPTLLLPGEAAQLRRRGVRFYLSAAVDDRASLTETRRFAALLARERLPYRVVLGHGGHHTRFWRRQLVASLEYACLWKRENGRYR